MSLKNGHNAPKALSQSASAIRQRLSKERRHRGAVCIQSVVEPDLVAALVSFGWLFEEHKQDPGAVHDALSALTYQALSAAMRPARGGKAFVPVSLEAIQHAAGWMRPGTVLTAEAAGAALGTLARCAAQVGFDGPEYASRARQIAGIN